MNYIINIIIATASNLVGSFPMYVIPEYKCGRKWFVVIYALWGIILGNMKYFVAQYSTADVVLTIINIVTFFIIIILVVKRTFYKFIVAFGLTGFNSFTAQVIIGLLGMDIVADFQNERFFDMFVVHIIWATLQAVVLYTVLRRMRRDEISANIDKKIIANVLLITYFCTVSQQFINRASRSSSMENAFTYYFTFIIVAIMLARTYIVSRRKNIMEYNLAYEAESGKLKQLMAQNEYIAKLRHDYINQISVIKFIAQKDPQKAIQMLDEIEAQYRNNAKNDFL